MVLTSVSALLMGVSIAQSAPPPIVTRPAVRVSSPRSTRTTTVVTWDAGEVTCNNGVTFGAGIIPHRIPESTFRAPDGQPRVTYEFLLGEDGRALSIAPVAGVGSALYSSDLEPALAAARFDPQPRPTKCAVTFTRTLIPSTQLSLDDLITLVIHSRTPPVPKDTWQRLVPGDCYTQRKRQLEKHTPDYRKLPKRPGAINWVMFSFNIDERGAPYGIETIGGSGETSLEVASKKALGDSRWIDGDPREGCWRYDYTAADVIEAPKAPDLAQFGKSPDWCEADDRWAKAPRLTYPRNFQRRGIEGWAILRYDVASWGEIGNVELLDAQPASALGEAAKKVLMSAEYKKVPGGLAGCVERVVFRLPERGARRSDDEE